MSADLYTVYVKCAGGSETVFFKLKAEVFHIVKKKKTCEPNTISVNVKHQSSTIFKDFGFST